MHADISPNYGGEGGGWQRFQTESRPSLSGDTCPALVIRANTREGCLSFLCASLSTKIWPEIKGSFLPNRTSASLRAVIIAKAVQVPKWVWSTKLLWNSVFRNVFLIVKLTTCIFHAVLGRLSRKWWAGGESDQERMIREEQSSKYHYVLQGLKTGRKTGTKRAIRVCMCVMGSVDVGGNFKV